MSRSLLLTNQRDQPHCIGQAIWFNGENKSPMLVTRCSIGHRNHPDLEWCTLKKVRIIIDFFGKEGKRRRRKDLLLLIQALINECSHYSKFRKTLGKIRNSGRACNEVEEKNMIFWHAPRLENFNSESSGPPCDALELWVLYQKANQLCGIGTIPVANIGSRSRTHRLAMSAGSLS